MPAVFEHKCLSTIVEYAVIYDRLNVRNLVCMELALRRMQLHESAVALSPQAPSYEGARHFLGVPERRGGAIIAPVLTQYVASQLSSEAAIEKEKRKAREARAASSKSSPPGRKHPGKKDQTQGPSQGGGGG